MVNRQRMVSDAAAARALRRCCRACGNSLPPSPAFAVCTVERSVMWEVHVLQQLNHEHIVRVMDVIEVVDASYIIMQRVDGPELTEYMGEHPERRLPAWEACHVLGHLLSALRHAHIHGFLHCDIKPDSKRPASTTSTSARAHHTSPFSLPSSHPCSSHARPPVALLRCATQQGVRPRCTH